jgi:site-specific DNA recombinase
MGTFLREQLTALTEYDHTLSGGCDAFVRRLIEKVTFYEDKFTVEFKSDVTVDADE